MRKVPAAVANREFSKILREVANGETVVVTSRGKPVAEIKAAQTAAEDEEQRQKEWQAFIDRLRSQPVRNFGKATRDEMYD